MSRTEAFAILVGWTASLVVIAYLTDSLGYQRGYERGLEAAPEYIASEEAWWAEREACEAEQAVSPSGKRELLCEGIIDSVRDHLADVEMSAQDRME